MDALSLYNFLRYSPYVNHIHSHFREYMTSIADGRQGLQVGDEVVSLWFIEYLRHSSGVDIIFVIEHHIIKGIFAVFIILRSLLIFLLLDCVNLLREPFVNEIESYKQKYSEYKFR